ncbi:MAG: hydroxymethylglutaryl-CoA lyase [Cryobacterium sp.]|nr:hydroxymethylglutaryl-CoA lyase [Cryobacterium sp.]
MSSVEIIDVTPRDGLQNEAVSVSAENKVELIARLVELGARRIEAVSFVSPRHVPQMADADEVMAALPRVDGVSYIGLVVNERGADRAVAAGVDELNFVVPTTDAFASKNQNTTVAAAVQSAIYAGNRAAEAGIPYTVSFAVSLGCPYVGDVSVDDVLRAVRPVLDGTAVAEIELADTIGSGTPWSVTELFAGVQAVSEVPIRAHFHETRHTSLANTAAALALGVRRFDGSVGGLGGCPFAPGAAGNVSTEDLAWFLQRGGFDHGLDVDRAIETGRWICSLVEVEPRSGLAAAGFFPRA